MAGANGNPAIPAYVKLVSSNFTNGVCPFIFGNNIESANNTTYELSCYIVKPLNEAHKNIE